MLQTIIHFTCTAYRQVTGNPQESGTINPRLPEKERMMMRNRIKLFLTRLAFPAYIVLAMAAIARGQEQDMKGEMSASCCSRCNKSTCTVGNCNGNTCSMMTPEMMVSAKGPAHMSGMFQGVKANTGMVMHMTMDGKQILTLTDEFTMPDAPAPHWQVIDSRGNIYLLNMLKVKGDKFNKSIVLPAYIQDVSKVQIWCSWAEALLGEASFEKPVK